MRQQHELMKFDPASGEERPYPSHAAQYREYHGGVAWLFNPWTGTPRDARDIGSDVFGCLIVLPTSPSCIEGRLIQPNQSVYAYSGWWSLPRSCRYLSAGQVQRRDYYGTYQGWSLYMVALPI